MNDSTPTTRRTFIKSALGAGATLAALSDLGCTQPGGQVAVSEQTTRQPPAKEPEPLAPPPKPRENYKDLRVAFIGTGGMGGAHVEEMTKLGVSCLCYCDVDKTHWKKAAESFPNAKGYQDYREMFDKEHKNFDAVMIGIPDHQHYPATVLAMQAGKHVYTQKPLTHTPWEARQLAQAVKKYKVATQMGNQGHGMEGWRLIYEWVHSGALGDIKETHTWTNRPIWPQGLDRPEGEDAVPASLNWDVWLGPAPARPYKGKWKVSGEDEPVYAPFVWRGWWDFGCGALGDMACHTMDAIFATFAPGAPTSVEVIACTPVNKEKETKPVIKEMCPKGSIIKWHWPASGKRPAFDSYWYDGGLMPRTPPELESDRRMPETGNMFIGTKGTMLIKGDYCDSPRFIPETKMQAVGKPKQMLRRSPGQYAEWVMACVGDQPIDFPKSNFLYSAPFTEAILLGNIALRFGRKLEWDAANMKFTNLPEANQYVSKEYRKGWKFDV